MHFARRWEGFGSSPDRIGMPINGVVSILRLVGRKSRRRRSTSRVRQVQKETL